VRLNSFLNFGAAPNGCVVESFLESPKNDWQPIESAYLDPAVALSHFDFDGRARFVTFGTHRRLPVLTNDRVRKTLTDSIDKIRKLMEFQLIAYVFMPEHVHLVSLPNEKTEVGRLIGEIKRISSKGIHGSRSSRILI